MKQRWRAEMFHSQRGLCHWCNEPMQTVRHTDDDFATFEHLKRLREGGTSAKANIVLACRRCNNLRA